MAAPEPASESKQRVETLTWSGSREAAAKAVLDALPKDAIVRDDDDGVGRFAGERVLVIVSRDRTRLQMFQGSWGALKGRLEEPQLELRFEGADEGDVTVQLSAEAKGAAKGNLALDFLWNALTVAAIVVAYHFVRKLPVDVPLTAGVSVVGGAVWTGIQKAMGGEEASGLDELVRKALTSD